MRVKFENFLFNLQLYVQGVKSTVKNPRVVSPVLLGNINLVKTDLILV